MPLCGHSAKVVYHIILLSCLRRVAHEPVGTLCVLTGNTVQLRRMHLPLLRRVAVKRSPIARCHHAIILFPIAPEGKARPFSVVKMASLSSAAKLGLIFLIKTLRLLRTLLVIIRGAGPALLVLWRETYITYFPSISLILSKSRRRAVSNGPGLCPFLRPILAIRKSRTSMKSFSQLDVWRISRGWS